MDFRRQLLWVDGLAGATVGVLVLALVDWLSRLYQLPQNLLWWMGLANLAYASFSLSLARRRRRPLGLLCLLVAANGIWALACLRWAFLYRETASWFGLAQLVGEALFVGGLAILEWRWRRFLLER